MCITNDLILCGTLTDAPVFDHEIFGESFYRCTLSVPRLSGAIDLLPMLLPSRMQYRPEEGEAVFMQGQVRSYKKLSADGTHLQLTAFARELRAADAEETPENRLELRGCISKPVTFRTTPFMREIADMLLAVGRSYGKVDYIPCIAWGRNARYAGSLHTGDEIHIIGRLQSRIYIKTLPDGTSFTRTTYEVSCAAIETT